MEQRIKEITDFIFLSDTPASKGILIIPGTKRPGLADKAFKIFQLGLVTSFITTGAGINAELITEAEYTKQCLINFGVPNSLIFTDNNSTNTIENAINAKQIVNKYHLDDSVVILVAKTYHSRRVYMTFKKIFSQSKIYIVPAKDDRDITRTNWFKSPEKINKVMEEVEKIGKYYLKGDLQI